MLVRLRNINQFDFRFLYNLLKERNPNANISHKQVPTYSEHVKFIKSKPYTKWNVIEYGKQKIGSIYLSKNLKYGVICEYLVRTNSFGYVSIKIINILS